MLFMLCSIPKGYRNGKGKSNLSLDGTWFSLSKGNLELEDVGNEVWNELYLRSFFQEIEVQYGRTYFKMHDLIHDLATSLFSASASSNNICEIYVKGFPHMMSIGFAKVVSSYFVLTCKSLSR
uniref:Disease resistance protein RGA4 n=1 Tax=Solanum tuberosum TaxID=4113 RepID=M0ZV71_SOLTU